VSLFVRAMKGKRLELSTPSPRSVEARSVGGSRQYICWAMSVDVHIDLTSQFVAVNNLLVGGVAQW